MSTPENQNGLGWMDGERKLIFNTYNVRIAGQDHEWVQDELAVKVAIFCRIGLEKNLDKTKAMVCTPDFILGKWGEQSYKKQATGEAENLGRGRGCG